MTPIQTEILRELSYKGFRWKKNTGSINLWDLKKCKYPTWEGDQRQDNRNGYIDKEEKKPVLWTEICLYLYEYGQYFLKRHLRRGNECG